MTTSAAPVANDVCGYGLDAEQNQLRSNVLGETGRDVNCCLGEPRPIQRDQQAGPIRE
jgi:hypothetical protein